MRRCFPARRGVVRRLVAIAAMAASLPAFADKRALDDDALREVSGAGVAVAVHLELNSAVLTDPSIDNRITIGFDNNGTKTYAVLQNFAGVADFFTITLNMRQRAPGDPGSDYFDIGLPQYVAFTQFGVRALAVITDPAAPITTANSYGSLLINGTMNMTGHFYLWPK
jgi:hypothetical protein